jgi:hypothetical protein
MHSAELGAFIVYFNVKFNILKQVGCALVGLIKDFLYEIYRGGADNGNSCEIYKFLY